MPDNNIYKPEGLLIGTPENNEFLSSAANMDRAMRTGAILESRASLCDSQHNLYVDIPCGRGIIPREETALGIRDGTVRDVAILTRVNRPVCFRVIGITQSSDGVPLFTLSRKAVQEDCRARYLDTLGPGDIIPAKVTHIEPFGCFVDIGCGLISMISIDNISISRISHPRDRFTPGQLIRAVVRDTDLETGRINLSHKELLGTWLENAAMFELGQTVSGIVRSIEEYGIFVELAPNLTGLAELRDGVCVGQQAAVFIKNILPDRMKIKLSLVDFFTAEYVSPPLRYFITSGHISAWVYSPPGCSKVIETVFDV